MAMETDLAIMAREAITQLTAQPHPRDDSAAQQGPAAPAATAISAPEEGLTLSLSAQGKLLAALATAVDSVTAASAGAQPAASAALAARSADPTQPVTRKLLFALEAQLVAARGSAEAIQLADAELPPSQEPQRLARARQATESLYGHAANPFAGLGRAELSAIVYDDSGAYTINERYAAANQRTELDQRFWAPVFQRALESGNWQPVITAALVFYVSLSALERTAYPDNYPQLLQQYLDLYRLQPQAVLPAPQQADLARMLETLVLPGGPLALAGGAIQGLLLPRLGPSLAEILAAAPRLADLVQVNNLAHSVQDSSYLLLLQRVFGVQRREDEPAPARRTSVPGNGSGVGNMAALAARDFLSYGDRRYLAAAYAYALQQGIAPEEVDALAQDLARYRQERAGAGAPADAADAARALAHATRMSSEDRLIAQRLLSSQAARQTQLDHAFLAWLLDPAGGGWRDGLASGHSVSLAVLERLLAGLAGVSLGHSAGPAAELEPAYRLVLERIALQEAAANRAASTGVLADAAQELTRAAQMAALARSDAAETAFLNNALMLLRMYRLSLTMSPVEQRTLAELVYSSLKQRRRPRMRRGKLFLAWAERSPLMPSLPG